jgi:hypothetical protein
MQGQILTTIGDALRETFMNTSHALWECLWLITHIFWVCQWVLRTLSCTILWGFILERDAYCWFFLGNAQIALDILFYFVIFIFIFHLNNFNFYLSFVPNFNMKVLQVCGIIMGLGSWEFIQNHLTGHQVQF